MANPALGDFRSLVRFEARLPIRPSGYRLKSREFRNLYLNQRVAPVSSMISRKEWMACAGPAKFQPGEDVYLALDLSTVVDLTALVMGSAGEQTRVKAYLWKPEDQLTRTRQQGFRIGERPLYAMGERGTFIGVAGEIDQLGMIANQIIELCQNYNVLGMALRSLSDG